MTSVYGNKSRRRETREGASGQRCELPVMGLLTPNDMYTEALVRAACIGQRAGPVCQFEGHAAAADGAPFLGELLLHPWVPQTSCCQIQASSV